MTETLESQTARLESLKQRHTNLTRQKLAAEAEYNQYSKNLAKLQDEALAAFGTSDPQELQALYEKLTAENEAKLNAFDQALKLIEISLSDITG